MCEAVRAISTRRFGRMIGTATNETLDRITGQLMLWLAIGQPPPV
jgi:mRNA-degrading endonuclease toxin of MazEF toxin-antitoxin module